MWLKLKCGSDQQHQSNKQQRMLGPGDQHFSVEEERRKSESHGDSYPSASGIGTQLSSLGKHLSLSHTPNDPSQHLVQVASVILYTGRGIDSKQNIPTVLFAKHSLWSCGDEGGQSLVESVLWFALEPISTQCPLSSETSKTEQEAEA
ncbi:hypothetical protein EYF80_013934 [Liparis tanakae]|uniref:Uncharacterized protein n=1 Tax=Liparis tanakae TaxID=230148 RepID=A0A4Z2ID16_9TELE|nr:hypothetical protein EYF80_013934 [Liparis tanakae]